VCCNELRSKLFFAWCLVMTDEVRNVSASVYGCEKCTILIKISFVYTLIVFLHSVTFDVRGSVHRNINLRKNQQDATV
jgi:hypothetical protein